MRIDLRPAFYASEGGTWRDYVNILHVPYTVWHLTYVVLGAAVSPTPSLVRTLGTLLAFFLAVGIGAHTLDELRGRPLRTTIPGGVLLALAGLALAGAAGLGVIAAALVSVWLIPFIVFGFFIVLAYNLELLGGRFHSDLWFALAWGAFPALTAYWINATALHPAGLLLAAAAFTLSLTQRTLSSYARLLRRGTRRVEGSMEMQDGQVVPLTAEGLILTPERALRWLTISLLLLAGGLVAFRSLDDFSL